jgi:uncharacterized protein YndB with AHSA1/START domain
MSNNLIASVSTVVNATPERVWRALTDPATIKRYMFGTTVQSDWKAGSPITWKGEWEGKTYEDKGVIARMEPPRLIQYTHFSPLSGKPDLPENYHTVTIELERVGDQTRVSLAQDNNATEQVREHSAKNWQQMLNGLKTVVEE